MTQNQTNLDKAKAMSLDSVLDVYKQRFLFVEAQATTWYPGRGEDGKGILCWGPDRKEAQGRNMTEAIDIAIAQHQQQQCTLQVKGT